MSGYGWDTLLNSRRRRRPEQVASVFLREFLADNGYFEFTDAITEAVTDQDGPVALR